MIAIMFSLKVNAQLLSYLHCSLGMNRTAVSRSLRDSRHLTGTLDLNQNVLRQTNLLLPLPLRHHPFLKNEHPISDLVLLHRHRDRYLVLAIVFLLHFLFLEEIWKLLQVIASRLIVHWLGSSMRMYFLVLVFLCAERDD